MGYIEEMRGLRIGPSPLWDGGSDDIELTDFGVIGFHDERLAFKCQWHGYHESGVRVV